jgi:hypothetical protein
VGSGAGLGALDKKKNTPAGIQTPDRPACSLVVIPTRISGRPFYRTVRGIWCYLQFLNLQQKTAGPQRFVPQYFPLHEYKFQTLSLLQDLCLIKHGATIRNVM